MISPMLCETVEGINSILGRKDFLFQRKEDGERAFLASEGGVSKLFNRRGSEVSAQFPEITRQSFAFDFILDGEIVCGKRARGAPSTQGRASLTNSWKIGERAARNPAEFRAFDVLEIAGEEFLSVPIERRLKELAFLTDCLNVANVKTVASFVDGLLAWKEAEAQGWEGLIGKKIGSLYEQRRSGNWLKIKAWRELTTEVTGYTSDKRPISALKTVFGNVNCSVSEKRMRELMLDLDEIQKYVVEVDFMELSEAGKWRFPRLKQIYKRGEIHE